MPKFFAWVKSLSWIVVLGAIAAAIGMILNARRAGAMEARISYGEETIKGLREGTVDDIQQAGVLQGTIDGWKDEAKATRKKSEKSLERIGQDETMADIAERFNGKRVRSRTDTADGSSGS